MDVPANSGNVSVDTGVTPIAITPMYTDGFYHLKPTIAINDTYVSVRPTSTSTSAQILNFMVLYMDT